MIVILSERPFIINRFNFGFFVKAIKIIIWKYKTLTSHLSGSYYPSHRTVSREVIEGLLSANQSVSIDPFYIGDFKNIVVLAHPKWFKILGGLYCNRDVNSFNILCGANVVHSMLVIEELLFYKLNIMTITPCDWVSENYIMQAPLLKDKIKVWPCGLDVNYWKPINNIGSREVIVLYVKHENIFLLKKIKIFAAKNNLKISVINYGKYSLYDWKQALKTALVVVYISNVTESQGVAQFESWAMDVPTFIQKNDEVSVDGWSYVNATSSPYLTKNCGAFWSDYSELEILLSSINSNIYGMKPREYILKNFTREIATKKLMEYIYRK